MALPLRRTSSPTPVASGHRNAAPSSSVNPGVEALLLVNPGRKLSRYQRKTRRKHKAVASRRTGMARKKARRSRRRNPFVRVKGKRYHKRYRKPYSYRRGTKRVQVRRTKLKRHRRAYTRYYYGKSSLGVETEIPRKYRERASRRWARWASEHPQESMRYTQGLERTWAERLKKAGYSVARKNALPLMDNPRRRRKRRRSGKRRVAYRTRRRRVAHNPRKGSRRRGRRRRKNYRATAVYYRRRRRGKRRAGLRRLYSIARNPRKGRGRKGRRGRGRKRRGSAYRATSVYYRRRRGKRSRIHRLYRRLRNPGAIAPVPIINPFLGGLSFNPLVDEVLIPAAAGAAGFYAARLLGNLVRDPISKVTGADWAPVATNAAVLGAAWYLRDRIPFRFRTPILIGVGLAFLDSVLTKFGVGILTARDGAEKAGAEKEAAKSGLDMDLAEISSVGREYDDSDLYGHGAGAYVQEPTAGMGAYVSEPTAGTGAYVSEPTAGMGNVPQISQAAAGLSEIDSMIDEAEQTSGIGAEVSEAAAGFGAEVNEAAAGGGWS